VGSVLPVVVAVSRSARHTVTKAAQTAIELVAGIGVAGDAHAGATVQHRYDKRRDPARVNERQVHLIGAELFDELTAAGFAIAPGELGENITTRGIMLTGLPAGTRLRIGDAVIELRGVRAPCALLDRLHPGLCAATSMPYANGRALRHGVMGVVVAGGDVRPGAAIAVDVTSDAPRALPII
jgi:MOSC domain-containing protein YiiM